MKWGCIVLAGDDGVPIAPGLPPKPLIEFGGRASVARVLDAMTGFDRVVTVGIPEAQPLVHHGTFELQGRGAVDNMRIGLEALAGIDAALLIPSDSPFLTFNDLIMFCQRLERAAQTDRWCGISFCPMLDFKKKYPGVPVGGAKLREGRLVSGALYACTPSAFAHAEPLIRKLRASRKSQVRMAMQFGLMNVIRLATGRTSLADAAAMLSRLSGVEILLDAEASPESCLDFDDEADLAALRKILP